MAGATKRKCFAGDADVIDDVAATPCQQSHSQALHGRAVVHAALSPAAVRALLNRLGLHERLRREPGHVPDAAEGAEEPDAQPDADGGGAWNECVT